MQIDERTLLWLAASLEPFGAPAGRQVEIFAGDHSDVIEKVNQVEDLLKWKLPVLQIEARAGGTLEAEIAAICEDAAVLGRESEVPDLGTLSSAGWTSLRQRAVAARERLLAITVPE